MKTWNQLFVRHGWKLEQREENVFDCKGETVKNMDYLVETLEQGKVAYSLKNGAFYIQSEPVAEKDWIKALNHGVFHVRGRSEGFWFEPGKEEPKVRELDVYISGIVRQLNRLGFYTMGSCEGHDNRPAHVMVTKGKDIKQLVEILLAMGMKRVYYQDRNNHYHVSLHLKREELLDLAEKLSLIDESWVEKGYEFLKEQMFYNLLEEILSIPGESGNEGKVRQYVKEKLAPFVDKMAVDRNGNLLAEKTYKTGHGPTILLSAHLDTVIEIEAHRSLIKEEGIWTSSEGILGADDRAGVAVLLQTAQNLLNSSFSGKVKYIFTVGEERGLFGARQVDEYFLWGVDAAIVVDRRGKADIVISCGGHTPFCHKAYGEFFEKVATQVGLTGWQCTNGGSSDTKVWASHGIQSVNLSAGYGYEHSEREYLDVAACYNVTKLVIGFFERTRDLRMVLRGIEREDLVESIVKNAW